MTPEDMKRARDAIRATELDCAQWSDDLLDEIITAVIMGGQPADQVPETMGRGRYGEPVDDQFSAPEELSKETLEIIAKHRAKVAELRPPPAPGLSAVSVARAFEIMLPTHDGGLTLMHNPHLDLANPDDDAAARGEPCSVAEYLKRWERRTEFTGPVEQQKIEATGDIWVLCWKPPRALGVETRLAAATLPALAMWLQDNGLAFGS